jgi:hypothetical protein
MAIFTRSFLSPYTINGAANNVSITNNYFGGFINSIFFMTLTNGLIAYNYFDSNASCTGNHGETINPSGNTNVTIRNNYFFDPYVAAIGGHAWNGINDYIYIYNNIFKGNYASSGKSVNMIIGNENDPDQMYCHTYIYSNTFLDINVVAYGIFWMGPTPSGCTQKTLARNNLFYGNSGAGFQYGDGNNTDHDYNYYSNNSASPSETDGVYDTISPFIDYAGGDYRLKSTALAVDRGTTLSSPYNIDYVGTSRPQGSAWDMGAFEYVDGKTPNSPVLSSVQ